ncbi:hypothetical protein M8C21_001196 [Ambrosia artemisiifolia]|uniref:Uncharacterized protein n=1 Tax=Ambrosia artemisiifolia TaxID=4212 RepID=A0AAD5CEU2_AMBAR|nr:hypothetical protein M8C21_001196 [Ambrosia artemisiifolia]
METATAAMILLREWRLLHCNGNVTRVGWTFYCGYCLSFNNFYKRIDTGQRETFITCILRCFESNQL